MFFQLYDFEPARKNPAKTASKISWHFASLMAFVSLVLNALLYREFKRTVLQVVHKIRRPRWEGNRKNHLRCIREAKEIVSILWTVGLGLWAVLGVLGSLIGNFDRRR